MFVQRFPYGVNICVHNDIHGLLSHCLCSDLETFAPLKTSLSFLTPLKTVLLNTTRAHHILLQINIHSSSYPNSLSLSLCHQLSLSLPPKRTFLFLTLLVSGCSAQGNLSCDSNRTTVKLLFCTPFISIAILLTVSSPKQKLNAQFCIILRRLPRHFSFGQKVFLKVRLTFFCEKGLSLYHISHVDTRITTVRYTHTSLYTSVCAPVASVIGGCISVCVCVFCVCLCLCLGLPLYSFLQWQ